MPTPFAPRKLLVAAAGVATLNYVSIACTPTPPTSGNLPAPSAQPTAIPTTTRPDPLGVGVATALDAGSLVAPVALRDAGAGIDAGGLQRKFGVPTSGNLMAPPRLRDGGFPL